jgi:hypothetical protein
VAGLAWVVATAAGAYRWRRSRAWLMWDVTAEVIQSDGHAVRSAQQAFVDQLNQRQHGGFADWRAPTIEELGSLLETRATKTDRDRRFADPVLGRPYSCTSADRVLVPPRNEVPVYVSFSVGGLGLPTAAYRHFILCPVRSLGPRELRPPASAGTK